MAKAESLEVKEKWIDPKSLPYSGEVNADQAQEVVTISTLKFSVGVVLPSGRSAEGFDATKAPSLVRFRDRLKKSVGDSLSAIVRFRNEDRDGDEEAFKKADSELKRINGIIEEALKDFRAVLREAVAEFISKSGSKVKASDLMTIGSDSFKALKIRPGVFENESAAPPELLDISKALTRKKWQFCGIAWRSGAAVLTIRLKKAFKDAELKDLRDALPDGLSRGAHMIGGRIRAASATKVEFEFPTSTKPPNRKILRKAFKEQTGAAVFIQKQYGVWVPDEPDDKKKDNGKKSKKPNQEKR
ncbi:hypothetical protein SH501x_003631 [Pirellulaceae bacterium SH501]